MTTTIVKYCKKEHNIMRGCPTIHLGTVQYYRDLDPNFSNIADPNEATGGHSLKPGVYKLDKEQARNVTGGVIEGPVEINVPADGKSLIGKKFPNLYVFCMTRHENGEKPSLRQARTFDKNYNSWYTINNVVEFRQRLLHLLMAHLAFSNFAEDFTKTIENISCQELISRFRVIVSDNKVQYVESKVRKVGEDDVDSLPSPSSVDLDWVFTKDNKYKDDMEHRIAFIPHITGAQNRVLPVRKEPLLLPTNTFSGICEAN